MKILLLLYESLPDAFTKNYNLIALFDRVVRNRLLEVDKTSDKAKKLAWLRYKNKLMGSSTISSNTTPVPAANSAPTNQAQVGSTAPILSPAQQPAAPSFAETQNKLLNMLAKSNNAPDNIDDATFKQLVAQLAANNCQGFAKKFSRYECSKLFLDSLLDYYNPAKHKLNSLKERITTIIQTCVNSGNLDAIYTQRDQKAYLFFHHMAEKGITLANLYGVPANIITTFRALLVMPRNNKALNIFNATIDTKKGINLEAAKDVARTLLIFGIEPKKLNDMNANYQDRTKINYKTLFQYAEVVTDVESAVANGTFRLDVFLELPDDHIKRFSKDLFDDVLKTVRQLPREKYEVLQTRVAMHENLKAVLTENSLEGKITNNTSVPVQPETRSEASIAAASSLVRFSGNKRSLNDRRNSGDGAGPSTKKRRADSNA